MAEDTGGTMMLGLLITGVGVFAVDYAFSDPGQSWYDQFTSWIKGEEPAEAHADTEAIAPSREHSAISTPRSPSSPARRIAPVQQRLSDRRGYVPPPTTKRSAPALHPQEIPSSMANEAVRILNDLFSAHLPTGRRGPVPPEMRQWILYFQKQFGLPLTGTLDPKTFGALRSHAGLRGETTRQLPLPRRGVSFPPIPPAPSTSHLPTLAFAIPGPGLSKPALMQVQHDINTIFGAHVLDEDGGWGAHTSGALTEIQKAHGLHPSGMLDADTATLVKKLATEGEGFFSKIASSFRAGAGGDWSGEIKSLSAYDQSVIQKVIDTETDPRALDSLSRVLKTAGFPQTSAAVMAKSSGTTKTGWGIGDGWFDPVEAGFTPYDGFYDGGWG